MDGQLPPMLAEKRGKDRTNRRGSRTPVSNRSHSFSPVVLNVTCCCRDVNARQDHWMTTKTTANVHGKTLNVNVLHCSACDSRHKLAERALIAVFGLLPKRNCPLKASLRLAFSEEVPCEDALYKPIKSVDGFCTFGQVMRNFCPLGQDMLFEHCCYSA